MADADDSPGRGQTLQAAMRDTAKIESAKMRRSWRGDVGYALLRPTPPVVKAKQACDSTRRCVDDLVDPDYISKRRDNRLRATPYTQQPRLAYIDWRNGND